VALREDGSLWTWGANWYGQLGNGTWDEQTTPAQVGADREWAAVAGGDLHTLGMGADGSLWAWGDDDYGALGDGAWIGVPDPVQVSGGANDWAAVQAGVFHTAAIKADGTLWVWGYNERGQLGDGTTAYRTTPSTVGADANWASVSCGYEHTAAIKKDGSLWAWGWNSSGEVGDGTNDQRNAPVRVGTRNDWTAVSCGYYHTLALRDDGSLWAWGANDRGGQLGIGASANQNAPVQVGADTSWAYVSAGAYHSMAMQADGSLWAWGWNNWGQLGLGHTTDRNTPTKVGDGWRLP
jgi:alpha-tubulin suppressor-like RCC1 family protein